MDDLRQSLNKRLNYYGLAKQASAARVCALADEVADGEWKAVSFRNGILKIMVESNEKAYLVKLKSAEIIERVNKKLGRAEVLRLTFKVG